MDLHRHPKLVVLTGPSGVGKTDLRVRLMQNEFMKLKNVVTCTTREPRGNEQHGKDYFFYDKPQFEKMIAGGEMLEHATVYGNYYGVRMKDVDNVLTEGHSPLFTVDVQGASTIQSKYDPTVIIFIKTPTLNDLENLLRSRGTDSEEKIAKRIAIAPAELAREKEFGYSVINEVGKFEETYYKVCDIIRHELLFNKRKSKSVAFFGK